MHIKLEMDGNLRFQHPLSVGCETLCVNQTLKDCHRSMALVNWSSFSGISRKKLREMLTMPEQHSCCRHHRHLLLGVTNDTAQSGQLFLNLGKLGVDLRHCVSLGTRMKQPRVNGY